MARKLSAIEQDLCELLEERSINKSTFFTTQLPLDHWSEVIETWSSLTPSATVSSTRPLKSTSPARAIAGVKARKLASNRKGQLTIAAYEAPPVTPSCGSPTSGNQPVPNGKSVQGDEDVRTCWVQTTMASDRVRAVDLPGARLPFAGRPQLADLGRAWQSVRLKKRGMRLPLLPRGYQFRGIRVWGLACVAAAHVAIADPATETSSACEVSSPREAGTLADKLFEKGEYQHAGACYQACGYGHRQLAFLKAVGPDSEEISRALKAQGDAVMEIAVCEGRACVSQQPLICRSA